jgi:SAM-dependent methyltransferase
MLAGVEPVRSDRGLRERRGWFHVPGVQAGDRTLEEQVQGLDAVAHACAGRAVLDIGCAEGLIARWLCGHGAKSVDCIGIIQDELDAGAAFCAGFPVRFFRADLRRGEMLRGLKLRRAYDVVLLLSIVHKMRDPDALLGWAAKKARRAVAIRLPGREYNDRAHISQRHDIVAQMNAVGWSLHATYPTCREEWLGTFTRSA